MILHNMTCADTIPEQCADCLLLKQCRELNCLKRRKCASRKVEPNDIRDEMSELTETLILR